MLIGPGLYNATRAIISSRWFGFICVNASRIPELSSWNKPTVLPLDKSSNTLWSSYLIFLISKSLSLFCTSICVLLITVKVFKPKKSNLISPAFSAEYMLRFKPSNFRDKLIRRSTLLYSFISFWSFGSELIHWFKFIGLEGSNGIILQILSTNP